jgi:hypothetical protein
LAVDVKSSAESKDKIGSLLERHMSFPQCMLSKVVIPFVGK